MNLLATTAIGPHVGTYLELFESLARRDRFGVHRLVDDARAADVILFLDGHQHHADLALRAIVNHPLVRTYPKKSLVYCELDQPWCVMPGLYVSMPAPSFDWRMQRPCGYLFLLNALVEKPQDSEASPSLLFSYMGRRCHPVRDRILNLSHDRAHIEDTTAFNFFGAPTEEIEREKRRYAAVIRDSQFVLCPRGSGLSSFRLFETLAAGRVPVIISDDWVPPLGPAWNQSSIRVREADVEKIPAIIESHESLFDQMREAARRQWEDWFSPEVLFHRIADTCAELVGAHGRGGIGRSRLCNRRYLYLWARAMKWKWRGQLIGG